MTCVRVITHIHTLTHAGDALGACKSQITGPFLILDPGTGESVASPLDAGIGKQQAMQRSVDLGVGVVYVAWEALFFFLALNVQARRMTALTSLPC